MLQVLAGALKDNGRGRVVGERTFGKGLIQTIVELSDGSGVAVTVAKYQTPAGTDINKVICLLQTFARICLICLMQYKGDMCDFLSGFCSLLRHYIIG